MNSLYAPLMFYSLFGLGDIKGSDQSDDSLDF